MLIRNATLLLEGKAARKDILIQCGKIKSMGHFRGKGIDATGLFALPGIIDAHVHLREPGATQKEDFRTGTRA
ncbi:MAG TPA: hypothetical protein PKJ97_03735, partial [Candidatus Bilamarchaeaceae archaeon]|nr:hypothetical protein [Candidatus Bilamarchaeaceae archaeon]